MRRDRYKGDNTNTTTASFFVTKKGPGVIICFRVLFLTDKTEPRHHENLQKKKLSMFSCMFVVMECDQAFSQFKPLEKKAGNIRHRPVHTYLGSASTAAPSHG
jgi:hypothetical protein